MLLLLALSACTDEPGTEVSWEREVRAVSGDIVWEVDFDADAEANGRTDCSYSRHYEAVEDRSSPWLCKGCERVYRADIEMTYGLQECYAQVTDGEPAPVEWIGEDGGTFRRTSVVNGPLSNQGALTHGFDGFTTNNEVDSRNPAEDRFHFSIHGVFVDDTALADPMHGLNPPVDEYACGWSRGEVPPYVGGYDLAVGAALPDGVFRDQCGEPVRLYDLLDRYVVIHVSAIDCPPCRQMARTEDDLVQALAHEGILARSVTLLAPTLDDVLLPTQIEQLAAWADQYGLADPVLQDRGYGVYVVGAAAGDAFAFPTSVVVAPSGEVVYLQVGFGDWTPFEEAVLDHASTGR